MSSESTCALLSAWASSIGFAEFDAQDQEIQRMRCQVRLGLCADNPACIMDWFRAEEQRVTGGAARWRLHLAQFRLLIDTFADDLVDTVWRDVCLDRIYYPLGVLSRLAETPEQRRDYLRCVDELRVVSHYFSYFLHK